MFELSVTPDLLAYIFAGLAAVLFDWFPGLSTWYGNLSELKKRQVMGAVLVVVLGIIYGGVCVKVFTSQISCDATGLAALVQVLLISLGINQGVHLLTKPESKIVPASA